MLEEHVEETKYYPLSKLFAGFPDELYGMISENAPFSWGDNDRTLVTADRFLAHFIETLEYEDLKEEDYKKVFDTLEQLSKYRIYIDLEN